MSDRLDIDRIDIDRKVGYDKETGCWESLNRGSRRFRDFLTSYETT